MKLLFTSSGIKNTRIHNALVDLLGKPITEASALYIPTAIYPFPGGAVMAWRLMRGGIGDLLYEVGWKSLGVLELTALPGIQEDCWVPMLQETDALLVGGGDPLYLCHWMRQLGLADLWPSLRREMVYGGQCPRCGERGQPADRFCMRCALPLRASCPDYKQEVLIWATFCPHCAHPLTPAGEQAPGTTSREVSAVPVIQAGEAFARPSAVPVVPTAPQSSVPGVPNVPSGVQTGVPGVPGSSASLQRAAHGVPGTPARAQTGMQLARHFSRRQVLAGVAGLVVVGDGATCWLSRNARQEEGLLLA